MHVQEEDRKRHLLRVWITPPDGWALPDQVSRCLHSIAKDANRWPAVSWPANVPASSDAQHLNWAVATLLATGRMVNSSAKHCSNLLTLTNWVPRPKAILMSLYVLLDLCIFFCR